MRRALAIALASVALVAACSVTIQQGTLPPPTPGSTDAAAGSPGDQSPGSTGQVTIDSSLLAALPRTVDSLPVTEDSDGDDQLRADDVAPTIATAGVAAVAANTQTSDLALVFVLRLIPGTMTDDVFTDWRDSYDAGACAGESQVVGKAESDVVGNHVFIGTCATGLRTYHAWLKDKGLLISISSTGDKRLGLVMLGNLPK
jgi:hypothetical protein